MSEPVKPRRIAIGAGLLVALYVVTSFLGREVPDRLVSLLGGPTGVDRIGGLRVQYQPPAGMGDARLLEYPGVSEDQVAELLDVLVGGGLSMREVLESDFALRLGLPLAGQDEPSASGVVVDVDQWRPERGGDVRSVPYLVGPSREVIEGELAASMAIGAELPALIGYERVEPFDGARDPRPYWRTYELAGEAMIDGSMIDNATMSYDPNTNRPIVLLDFTREGAQRFCDVTERVVDKKLAIILGDRVRSAPIINGAICGGRASITMGGNDPQAQEREARALVALFAQGAMPAGGTLVSQKYLPPTNVVAYEWAARLGLGLLAGLVAGFVTLFVVAFARPRWRAPVEPSPGSFPWRRLGVTLLAPLALIIGGMIGIPGINMVEVEHVVRGSAPVQFTVVALGVMPILSTFVIVELVALAVPRLRWRRHDIRGRIGLGKVVAVASVVVALVQAYFVATYLETLNRAGAQILSNPGWKTHLAMMGSLATVTVLLAVVAGLIREHGLGNGYGALVASTTLLVVLRPIFGDVETATNELVGPFGLADLNAVITAIVIAAATTCVLRWRIAGSDREPVLRVPTSGISPVNDTGGLLLLVVTLSALGFGTALVEAMAWMTELRARTGLILAIVVVSVPACSWLFGRPKLVERIALQASLDRPSWNAWWRATAVSAWLVVGVVVIARFAVVGNGLLQSLTDAVGVMVVTAVALDIAADARAYRRTLVPAGILHQIQYAGVVERMLSDAQIPCHLHASHLRTLLVFFGPFVPVIVMVPEEHAAQARTLIGGVLQAPTGVPPVARVTDSSAA